MYMTFQGMDKLRVRVRVRADSSSSCLVRTVKDHPADRIVLCRICAVWSGLTFEARQRRVTGVRRARF